MYGISKYVIVIVSVILLAQVFSIVSVDVIAETGCMEDGDNYMVGELVRFHGSSLGIGER